jgi:hypothetical protein
MSGKETDASKKRIEDQKSKIIETPSDTNSDNQEDIDAQNESNYQNAVRLMSCINSMSVCNSKMEMYNKAADYFNNLTGYKDSEECSKTCIQLAKQTKSELDKNIYDKALKLKNSARRSEDYLKAAEEFSKVSGYSNADDMIQECNQLSNRIEKKSMRFRLIRYGIVFLFILAFFVGIRTSHAKYYFANINAAIGSYNPAIKMYQRLGPYKDCVERLTKCQYLEGQNSKEKGDYASAVEAFAGAGNYKDSEEQKAEAEKQLIKNSTIGSKVRFGDGNWRVMDIEDGRALLLKNEVLPGMAYHNTFGDVTWETSVLRQYLNSEFLQEAFSESERKNIILSDLKNEDNSTYQTDGGNDTQDSVFILSNNEAIKYQSAFPEFKSISWLRSPGNSQSSASFLSVNGTVMDYGYIATCDEIYVRPALWYNFE